MDGGPLPHRQNIQLKLQATVQQGEVSAYASALKLRKAEIVAASTPKSSNQVFPLSRGWLERSAASFASSCQASFAVQGDVTGHINGGQSNKRGLSFSQAISLFNLSGDPVPDRRFRTRDFLQSPDLIQRFQVLTSKLTVTEAQPGGLLKM